MKHYAVTVTSREKAELAAIASPAALGPREVRGRTICTLISPGTELSYVYTGNRFPSVPGYSAVFVAEEKGSDVVGIELGDIVFCMGPHRSFQQVDAPMAFVLPEGLTPEKAVLARLMGVSMTTLMTTTARPGDRVLVSGAGPVGYLAAQVFTRCGYEVLVVEPDEQRRSDAEKSGVSSVYRESPCNDISVAGTVAVVLECSGHEQAALDGCRMVRKRGEVVLVGTPWQRRTDLSAHELVSLIFHKYAVLRSGWEWELPHQPMDFRPHSVQSNLALALKWLAEGWIHVDGLIALVDPREAQTIYQNLLAHRTKHLFSIFDWRRVSEKNNPE